MGGYPYEVCNDGTVNRLGSLDKPMKTGKKNEGFNGYQRNTGFEDIGTCRQDFIRVYGQ